MLIQRHRVIDAPPVSPAELEEVFSQEFLVPEMIVLSDSIEPILDLRLIPRTQSVEPIIELRGFADDHSVNHSLQFVKKSSAAA